MTEQELFDLKQEIEQGKEDLSRAEGRKEALLEQLQKEYGVTSVSGAEKKIKQLEEEITELNANIETATEELEQQLYEGQDTEPEE